MIILKLYHKTKLSLETSSKFITDLDITYCLALHPHKDDIEHLCQRCLGSGLVDQILAGKVDVVACPYSL